MSSNWLLCSTSPPTQVSSVQHWEELSLTLAHQEEPGDQRTLQTFSYSFLLSHFLVRAQLTLQGAWGSLYFIIIFKINLFIYLFLAALGLCLLRAGATPHCGARASHWVASRCGARALGAQASVVVARGL